MAKAVTTEHHVTVTNLQPGDVVQLPSGRMVFGCAMPHPLHRELMLVLWLSCDGGTMRLEALHPKHQVGTLVRTGESLAGLSASSWIRL